MGSTPGTRNGRQDPVKIQSGRPASACGRCTHSITSSARSSSDVGIVRPSAFAVLRLTTSENASAVQPADPPASRHRAPSRPKRRLERTNRSGCAIGHQAAHLGKLRKQDDGGKPVFQREVGDRLGVGAEQRRRQDEESRSLLSPPPRPVPAQIRPGAATFSTCNDRPRDLASAASASSCNEPVDGSHITASRDRPGTPSVRSSSHLALN